MVATSGAQLLPQAAVKTLREELLPLTTVLTPNIPEARLLLEDAGLKEIKIENVDDLKQMARTIRTLGPRYVLLKGGHMPFTKDRIVASSDDERQLIIDILAGPDEEAVLETEFVKSRNTHGTGCSLACMQFHA